MKVISARQMQGIDRKAAAKYGIPSIILMENAAFSSVLYALPLLKDKAGKVLVLCGQGNNGGDGFACARHLINRGFRVRVYFTGQKQKLPKDAKINYNILRKMGQKINPPVLSILQNDLKDTDLIIDALLGIGVKKRVREPVYSVIKLINDSQRTVLSLDIPSGLDATSGRVHGIAVKASRTITFGLAKKGFCYPQSKEYIGELTVGDISLPRQLLI